MDKSISDEMRALQKELTDIELRVACREADTLDRLRMDLDVLRSENNRLKSEVAELSRQRSSTGLSVAADPESTLSPDVRKSLEATIASKDRVIETMQSSLTQMRLELVSLAASKDEEVSRLKDDLACRDEMLLSLQDQLKALESSLAELEASRPGAPVDGSVLLERVNDLAALAVRQWDAGEAHAIHSVDKVSSSHKADSCPAQPSHLSRLNMVHLDALTKLWDKVESRQRARSERNSARQTSTPAENRPPFVIRGSRTPKKATGSLSHRSVKSSSSVKTYSGPLTASINRVTTPLGLHAFANAQQFRTTLPKS